MLLLFCSRCGGFKSTSDDWRMEYWVTASGQKRRNVQCMKRLWRRRSHRESEANHKQKLECQSLFNEFFIISNLNTLKFHLPNHIKWILKVKDDETAVRAGLDGWMTLECFHSRNSISRHGLLCHRLISFVVFFLQSALDGSSHSFLFGTSSTK